MDQVPARQVRALYNAETVTVYQAYPPNIAISAAKAGKFVPPFKRDRMTWIKPSFLWMMYRCAWATNPGQERVLAVEITREGFDWALEHSCLSQYDRTVHADRDDWTGQLHDNPVRIQWDPERSLQLKALPYRSLQVGLSSDVVDRYVQDWTVDIKDITHLARTIGERVRKGNDASAAALLPVERAYPLHEPVAVKLNVTR